MKKKENEIKNYYLQEFKFYDGECFITFNILDINTDKMTINLAITNRGRISVVEYDLKRDKDNKLYFQYGVEYSKIEVDDFETISD